MRWQIATFAEKLYNKRGKWVIERVLAKLTVCTQINFNDFLCLYHNKSDFFISNSK